MNWKECATLQTESFHCHRAQPPRKLLCYYAIVGLKGVIPWVISDAIKEYPQWKPRRMDAPPSFVIHDWIQCDADGHQNGACVTSVLTARVYY